jgi:hypothetical protein
MSKVYVVISDSIIQSHESHGLHGVYSTESKATSMAIAVITSIAKRHYHNITASDICVDDFEFSYQSDNLEVYVSCIEQEVF